MLSARYAHQYKTTYKHQQPTGVVFTLSCRTRMIWTYDKTEEVVFWGCVSVLLAALLHVLGLCSWWTVFPTTWLLSGGASLILSSLTVSSSGKAVLVTGCDTGFGNSFALILDRLGFRVFAGCLHAGGEGANHLRREGSSRLHVLQMDVTNQEQLDKAAQEVKHLLPEGEVLWSLVNNAGLSAFGEVEWVPLNTYRKVAEVNVFGVISVTKTFLPLLRRARGRVVNMSSVAGTIGRGVMSPYNLTKFAIEGFSDCLRQEMMAWGVSVILVEPSNFSAATNINAQQWISEQGDQMWGSMSEEVRADYGKDYFDTLVKFAKTQANSGEKDMTSVLHAMTEAVTKRYPRVRYHAFDCYYFFKQKAVIHLPEWLSDLLYITRPPLRQLSQQKTTAQTKLD
ncbi:D-beta-hydroxybutyrate dehydrogenase, mitochondrial-like isoform X2 [Homarus americanus]|nr:D-beta-hydroxybutyrate dehydrogenase, mitochondrial-like isoform X2 [Homarus americanus]XP_042223159.1 D-beta-hydroxybutyrate dehydrogenase, mitochondrial-like isoform X2 [Homarus americanus]XP_042223160.1 D-beta-hydroxybutyrate dehydrogenase, mitochondrial-like isoform X2 [Homarus americanus]